MLLKPTEAAKALIKYLGSPEAGEIWAHLGGFASPNKLVPLSSYPDPVTQADAQSCSTPRASCSASTTCRAAGSRACGRTCSIS